MFPSSGSCLPWRDDTEGTHSEETTWASGNRGFFASSSGGNTEQYRTGKAQIFSVIQWLQEIFFTQARVQALHVAKRFYGKPELASKIEVHMVHGCMGGSLQFTCAWQG